MIEDGEFTFPVSEITIAGNFNDMFQNIVLADDLEFKYSTNSPTMLISGMTVGGKWYNMLATDILLSIAIVGIYTLIHVYLKTEYKKLKKIFSIFIEGFVIATILTGFLYYLIKYIAS